MRLKKIHLLTWDCNAFHACVYGNKIPQRGGISTIFRFASAESEGAFVSEKSLFLSLAIAAIVIVVVYPWFRSL